MPLNFPNSPTLDQVYSFGGKSWVWNGDAWQLQGSSAINNVVIGNTTAASGAFTTLSSSANTTLGDINGNLVPAANITYNLGNATRQWNELYLSGNTIFLGGAQITANATAITLIGPEGAEFPVTGNSAANTDGSFGTITATGNITGNYFIGNGSQLTGIASAYGNTEVAAYLPTYTGNLASLTGNVDTTAGISATGNITGNYFIGNGSQLTGVVVDSETTTVSSSAPENPSQGDVWINSNTGRQYIYFDDGTSNQWADLTAVNAYSFVGTDSYNDANVANFLPTYDGNLASLLGNITTTANISGGNLLISSAVIATGNVTGGNLITAGLISASGNVTGGNLITAGLVSASGNVTGGNIIGVANVDADGGVFSGNVSANFFIGNGSQLTGIASAYGNTEVAAYLPTYTGNLAGGNITVSGAVADGKGEIRTLPENNQNTAYTLTVTDVGKYIKTSANVTIPNSVFGSGQTVAVYNNSASAIAIVQSAGTTLYLVGTASTGNRALAQRGIATIFCVGANTFVVSGGGVA